MRPSGRGLLASTYPRKGPFCLAPRHRTGAGTVRRDECVLWELAGLPGRGPPQSLLLLGLDQCPSCALPGAPPPGASGAGAGPSSPPPPCVGTRGATTRSPGPPCGHRVTSSVPCHRSGLNRLRHRVWTQDASRSSPARPAPRPGHCCLYWGPQRWSLVTPLTQTLSAALTAAGGSTCRPTVSLWPPNEHVT